MQEYIQNLIPGAIAFALSVVGAVLAYIIGVRVIKWIRKVLKRMLQKRKVDEGVQQFLDAIARFVGYFILILMILSIFGVTTASVVALLGSAGLTLGLALQGSLANFAGGVLILLMKPFAVGDYIIEDTNKNEGIVKEISIFYTTLLTYDEKTIVIPNGTLVNNSIVNLTKSGRRRLDILVDISYSADLLEAKKQLMKAAVESTHRLQQEEPRVMVDALADNSVKLDVRVWTKAEDYWEELWELNEKIKLTLDQAGIEIAFPQLDVHLR